MRLLGKPESSATHGHHDMMRDHWIRSLSARLWVVIVATLAVSLALFAGVSIYFSYHFPEEEIARRVLIENVRRIASGVEFDDAGAPRSVRFRGRQAWVFDALPAEVKFRVLDTTGHILLASSGTKADGPWLGQPSSLVDTIRPAKIDGSLYSIATKEISRRGAVFYVQVAISDRFAKALIVAKAQSIPFTVRIFLLAVIIIFGVILQLTIGRVLKPLREVSNSALLIAPRNMTTRLSPEGIPSEIRPLIYAFNGALDRLESGFLIQQQFIAAAAHELKTPLTLIRGHIELQPEIRKKETLLRDVDLMARQVRQLLHLAEVSEAQNFHFEKVCSTTVAEDVVAYLADKAEARQVKVAIDVHNRSPYIHADRSALSILLKNLIENAINVSPIAGIVLLTINEDAIHIEDGGPGVRSEHIPHLFKRFWRAPESKYDGAGLGLAICSEIAVAHDWGLTVKVLTTGTRFTVWIPPASHEPKRTSEHADSMI